MSDKTDLAAKLEHFERLMAASEKRVADLEAKIADAGKPPTPTKPAPYQPVDYTRGASMPPSALREMAAAIPDTLARDLRADVARGNPVTAGTSLISGASGQGQVVRGTGWATVRPLEPPEGLRYVDEQVQAHDARDAAERVRESIWGKRK